MSSIRSPSRSSKPTQLPTGWPLQNLLDQQPVSEQDLHFDSSLQIGPVVQASDASRDYQLKLYEGNGRCNSWRQQRNPTEKKHSDFQPVKSAHSLANVNAVLHQDYAIEAVQFLPNAFYEEFLLQSHVTGEHPLEQSTRDCSDVNLFDETIDQSHVPELDFKSFWTQPSDPKASSADQVEINSPSANNEPRTPFVENTDPNTNSSSAIPNFFFRSPSHRLSQQTSLSRPLQPGDEVHLTDQQGDDSTGQVTYRITQVDHVNGLCNIIPLPRTLIAPSSRLVRAPIPHLGFASVFQPKSQPKGERQEADFEEVDFGVAKRRWVTNGERRYTVESWTCTGKLHDGIGDEEIAVEWT